MRILMAGPGGAIAMRRVIDWVCKQGHQVCLVADANPYHQQTPPNFSFVACDVGSQYIFKELANPSAEMSAHSQPVVEMLRKLAAEFQPDIVHLHFLTFLTDCCVQAGLKPLVVSVWGLLNFLLDPALGARLQNPALQRLLTAADGVIIESQVLLDHYRRLAAPQQALALIPLGVNTRLFCPTSESRRAIQRKMLSIDPETVVLLSPRGWSKVYQHNQILTAYRLARPYFTKPTLLVFLKMVRDINIKKIEALQQEVQQEAEAHGVAAEVRWLPPLLYELMPTAYNLADIIINYPREDAFPSTLIEAMACERPVISARLPSYEGSFIADFCTLVEMEKYGERPQGLIQGMIDLVNGCPQQRQPGLQSARQSVIHDFDEALAQKRLFALYGSLM